MHLDGQKTQPYTKALRYGNQQYIPPFVWQLGVTACHDSESRLGACQDRGLPFRMSGWG